VESLVIPAGPPDVFPPGSDDAEGDDGPEQV
jgi:hypothetical protein